MFRGVRPFNQLILLKSIEINGSICKLLSIEIWSKLDFWVCESIAHVLTNFITPYKPNFCVKTLSAFYLLIVFNHCENLLPNTTLIHELEMRIWAYFTYSYMLTLYKFSKFFQNYDFGLFNLPTLLHERSKWPFVRRPKYYSKDSFLT